MNRKRHTTTALLCLVTLTVAAPAWALEIGGIVLKRGPQDSVRVTRRNWAWGHVKKHPVISFEMKSNRYEYSLRHDSPGQPRVGIEAPTRSNWYQSGMFNLSLDGERFVATDETIEMGEGEKGRVSLAWVGEQGKLRFDFVLLPSDDRLYCQVTLEPKQAVERIEIALSNYISGFNRQNPDHVLHTAVRTIEEAGKTELDPQKECAIFYSDRALDPADGRGDGPSAIAISPAGLTELAIRAGGYGSTTILAYAPGTTRMRFAFWEFPKWPNRDALDYWRRSVGQADAVLRDPRTFAADKSEGETGKPTPSLPALPINAASADGQKHRDNLYYDLSTEVTTPHIRWAKPHANGPCRVLVIGPRWGQRETVELMQRFDMQCDVAMTMKHDLLAGRGYGSVQYMTVDRVARHLDQMLAKDLDVIVVAFFDWSQLLIEHRHQILRKIHDAGTGLVVIRPWKHDDFKQLFAEGCLGEREIEPMYAGIPWGELSLLRDKPPGDTIKAGVFGEGRWVALHYRTGGTNHCLTPCTWSWQPEAHWEYEYYQSLLARVLLWAGQKDTPVTIESMSAEPIDRTQAPVPLPVHIRSAAALDGLSLRTSFHRLSSREVIEGAATPLALSPGENAATVSVPCLPAGPYMVNVRVLSSHEKALAWSSFPLAVTNPCSITEVSMERYVHDAGEPTAGNVVLSRPLGKGETLAIRWCDNHGRLLAERTETEGRRWDVALDGIRPLGTNIHFLRAVLTDAKGEAAAGEREFSVRGRKRPAFHLATWEEPQTDYISNLWFRRFRDIGVDAIYYTLGRKDYTDAARLIARNNLFSAPNFMAYRAESEQTPLGPVHGNCLHDSTYQKAVDERNFEVATCWGRYDVLYYTDGSDKVMAGQCFAKPTLAAFREHLKQRYASVADLNRAWDTAFTSWDAVVPNTLKKAKARKHFTSWVEHTRFMETAFAENDRRMQATLRSQDADALMGHDGYGRLNSRDGADWWKLLQANSYYNLYTYQDAPQLEITRSIADCFPAVEERSIYYGSYGGQFGNYPFLRRLPWYALLHNYTGLFWWTANGKVTYGTITSYMVGPDFRCTKSYLASKEQIDEINAGIVQLISRAKRRHNGIAVYYDHESAVHAMTAFRHPRHLVTGLTACEHVLEDLGLQYEYVVPQQIESGRLAAEDHQVLILIHTLAMPATTAKAIEEFVRRGGLVITNETPATHDENLRPAPNGSLLASLLGEPNELRKADQGATLVLPPTETDYRRERFTTHGRKIRRRFADVLAHARLPRFAGMVPAEGDVGIPGLELVAYQSGEGQYLGFVHSAPGAVTTTVKIPEARHVYDLRSRQHLGLTKEWPLSLEDGKTALYAALPYAIDDVSIEAGAGNAIRGRPFAAAISLQTSSGKPTTLPHAFVVDVIDPKGRKRPQYSQVVVSNDQGRASVVVPFALNDLLGAWTVRVTERVSGQTCEAVFELTSDR